jgi:hypothetical protein
MTRAVFATGEIIERINRGVLEFDLLHDDDLTQTAVERIHRAEAA